LSVGGWHVHPCTQRGKYVLPTLEIRMWTVEQRCAERSDFGPLIHNPRHNNGSILIIQITSLVCLSPTGSCRALADWRARRLADAAAVQSQPDNGCPRCFFPREKLPPSVKFMLAAGLTRGAHKHTTLVCLHPSLAFPAILNHDVVNAGSCFFLQFTGGEPMEPLVTSDILVSRLILVLVLVICSV